MQIRPLDESLRLAHGAFLAAQPAALLYQSLAYQDFLCALLGARRDSVVACDGGGGIQGVLPLLSLDGPCGRVSNSLPFFGSNGGILASHADARRALLDWYNAHARAPDVASSTLVTNPLEPGSDDGVIHNCTDFRIGQLSLIAHPDDHEARLMTGFHHKTRNMVRKAQKSGITTAVENGELAFLRETHEENLAALGGTAKPAAFFDLLPRHFCAGKDYRIYLARHEGRPVAALLLFYFNSTVEYYTPVIRKEFRDLQPMSLLVFEAMRDASRAGFQWWNWGGTRAGMDGVYRFKHRWGAQDHRYFYCTQLNRPGMAGWDRDALLAAYPHFFVLPFSMLQPVEALLP